MQDIMTNQPHFTNEAGMPVFLFHVVDENDNPLSAPYMAGREKEFAMVARDIATKRGEPVYAYCGNGRDVFQPAPSVGMGVTISTMVDRYPGTIIAVSPSGAKVTVREDKAIRTDDNGMSQCQSYRFERDPEGCVHTFHRQGDGTYKSNGDARRLFVGDRGAYRCFEF